MLYRKPEAEIFPLCQQLGIGQLVWSPLAQGVLTGKYAADTPPPTGSRAAGRTIERFGKAKVLQAVPRLRSSAERLALSMPQLALAWVLNHQSVSAAIVGATCPEQLEENVGAVGVRLDRATLREIDDALAGAIRYPTEETTV